MKIKRKKWTRNILLTIFVLIFIIGSSIITFIFLDIYTDLLVGQSDLSYYSIHVPSTTKQSQYLRQADTALDIDTKIFTSSIEMKFWEPLILQGTKIPFPVRHPYLKPVPYIIEKEGSHRLRHPKFGLKIVKQQDKGWKEYVKFNFVRKQIFDLQLNSQPLFKIPLIRNILNSKSQQEIWMDMFSKNLTLDIPIKLLSWQGTKSKLKDFAYDLYILHLRNHYFGKHVINFFINKHSNVGVVKRFSTRDFVKMRFYLLHEDYVYTYDVSTRVNDKMANFFWSYLISKLEVVPISQEVQNDIYLSFSSLDKDEKLSAKGYSYLYSDLSIRRGEDAKDFLRKMIQFIERDRKAYYFLAPLYTYAQHRYKRTFSQKSYFVDEDQELKLRRNIDLEKAEEINRVKKEKVATPEKEFKTDQEEIEFNLKDTQGKFEEIEDEISL